MKGRYILATLALGCCFGHASYAAAASSGQAPAAILAAAPQGTVAFDDDGGRAQIVPRRVAVPDEVTYHGGPVVSGGNVVAIFLGSGWQEKAVRQRESRAMDVLTGRSGAATVESLSR
ncbi:MAG: hypothetical protein M3O15_08135, partial [Acidobacteriota bacterium]|nr:hypothetical protein [Acidobacteriota bacterium]